MAQRLQLFPSPALLAEVGLSGDAREALARAVLDERLQDAGVSRSNRGGWHSQPDLQVRHEAALRPLLSLLAREIGGLQRALALEACVSPPSWRFAMQAWAMAMDDGDYAVPHDHPDAHWAAVYWLDAGDADPHRFPDSGRLVLLRPTGARDAVPGLSVAPPLFELSPATDRLVVFPGWMQHLVQPYRGKRTRISIAVNVQVHLAPQEP